MARGSEAFVFGPRLAAPGPAVLWGVVVPAPMAIFERGAGLAAEEPRAAGATAAVAMLADTTAKTAVSGAGIGPNTSATACSVSVHTPQTTTPNCVRCRQSRPTPKAA